MPLTEDVAAARHRRRIPYSAQKAELEDVLQRDPRRLETEAYVFRPVHRRRPRGADCSSTRCPYVRLGERLPGAVRALFDMVPVLKPVLPDPGVPVPARPPRRRRHRAARRRARPRRRPASTTSRARATITIATSPTRSAGTRCPCPTSRSTPRPRSSRACRSCPPRRAGSRPARSPVLLDTAKARARAALAPAPRRARDAQGDRRGAPPRPQRLISPGATIAR